MHSLDAPAARKPRSTLTLSAAPGKTPVYQKAKLFAGAKEVLIKHRGVQYRLRETRNGKLILNI